VAALLGVKRKADANPAAVRLARCLPFADGRQIDFLARDIERGKIVSSIELQTRRRLVRELGCGDGVLPSQIENGSRLSSRATSSTRRSSAKVAPGRATPR